MSESPRGARELLEGCRSAIQALEGANRLARENSRQVIGVADSLSGSAGQGFELAGKVQSNVEALASELAAATSETEKLLEESRRISEILTLMADISSTTNVLSINASIVAARAGTLGKGFDVVAREVRKLSVSTEAALDDITRLVKGLQSRIASVSSRLKGVGDGILSEKESVLGVAGVLQGVLLSVEIIKSVSEASGEKAEESGRAFREASGLLDEAASSLAEREPAAVR